MIKIWIPDKSAIRIPTALIIVTHDVIEIRRAKILGERIFMGAHLWNRISAFDNDLYVH